MAMIAVCNQVTETRFVQICLMLLAVREISLCPFFKRAFFQTIVQCFASDLHAVSKPFLSRRMRLVKLLRHHRWPNG